MTSQIWLSWKYFKILNKFQSIPNHSILLQFLTGNITFDIRQREKKIIIWGLFPTLLEIASFRLFTAISVTNHKIKTRLVCSELSTVVEILELISPSLLVTRVVVKNNFESNESWRVVVFISFENEFISYRKRKPQNVKRQTLKKRNHHVKEPRTLNLLPAKAKTKT